jgi:hypothetical protein
MFVWDYQRRTICKNKYAPITLGNRKCSGDVERLKKLCSRNKTDFIVSSPIKDGSQLTMTKSK